MHPGFSLTSTARPHAQDATNDPHGPAFHFLPPANWMNDPNGLIYWQGQYHMFYQYNPHGPFWGTIHWGHAVSEDLVHWRHLPIALAPEPGTADEDGCWSGCAVDNDGVPTFIYSGARDEVQRACLATSADGLTTWEKYAGNPIIQEPPADLDLVAYRDHCVWREGDTWYQLMGAGITGRGGTALLYRSSDLRVWEYLHPLYVGDKHHYHGLWTGSMWECPDFFPLGDQHTLLISVWDEQRLHYSAALVGEYHEHHFTPLVERKFDHGDHHFYAPQSLSDNRGRRVVIGWVQEGRSAAAQRAAGWSGVMSLPREVRLGPDGWLRIRPIEELASLRERQVHIPPQEIPAGSLMPLAEVAGDVLELELILEPGRSGRCGLLVRRAPDGEEETLIVYDASHRQLVVERDRTSLDEDVDRAAHTAPLTLEHNQPLHLRVFLDRSVLEVFANERVSITTRVYPTRSDSLGVALLTEGSDARLESLDAWQMRSIWEA